MQTIKQIMGSLYQSDQSTVPKIQARIQSLIKPSAGSSDLINLLSCRKQADVSVQATSLTATMLEVFDDVQDGDTSWTDAEIEEYLCVLIGEPISWPQSAPLVGDVELTDFLGCPVSIGYTLSTDNEVNTVKLSLSFDKLECGRFTLEQESDKDWVVKTSAFLDPLSIPVMIDDVTTTVATSITAVVSEMWAKVAESSAIRDVADIVPLHGTASSADILAVLDGYTDSPVINKLRASFSTINQVSSQGGLLAVLSAIRSSADASSQGEGRLNLHQTPGYTTSIFGLVVGALGAIVTTVISIIFQVVGAVLTLLVTLLSTLANFVSEHILKTQGVISEPSLAPAWNIPIGSNSTGYMQPSDSWKYVLQCFGSASMDNTSIGMYPWILPYDESGNAAAGQWLIKPFGATFYRGSFNQFTVTGETAPAIPRFQINEGAIMSVSLSEYNGCSNNPGYYGSSDATLRNNMLRNILATIEFGMSERKYYTPEPVNFRVDSSLGHIVDRITDLWNTNHNQDQCAITFLAMMLCQATYNNGSTASDLNGFDFNPSYDDLYKLCTAEWFNSWFSGILNYCIVERYANSIFPGEPLAYPNTDFPSLSLTSLYKALLTTGAITLAGFAGSFMLKRSLANRATAKVSFRQKQYDDAVAAYSARPTTANRKAVARANRKLNRSMTWASWFGVTRVNGKSTGTGTVLSPSIPSLQTLSDWNDAINEDTNQAVSGTLSGIDTLEKLIH